MALLIGSRAAAKAIGVEPLGTRSRFRPRGCDPARMGLGPVYAIQRLLEKLTLTLEDAEIVEINEAFAAQVLAVLRKLKDMGIGVIPDERLNVNGGAIALGHPVGASGARLVLTALKRAPTPEWPARSDQPLRGWRAGIRALAGTAMSALTHPASAAAKTADSSESSDGESVSLCLGTTELQIVRFDRPGSSANILIRLRCTPWAGFWRKCASKQLRGLVIETAKPTVFIAGRT